jgi:hypothetical protein
MKYELALELKDAGFPQEGKGERIGSPDALLWRRHDRVYKPTLEELIEACGDNFFSLQRVKRFSTDSIEWIASARGTSFKGSSLTPIEAVARLWIAINKKI